MSGFLLISSLSPFSADWFTNNSPFMSFPSATIFSPALRYMISPTTTSLEFMYLLCPALITHTLLSRSLSRSFSKDRSLVYSDKVETQVEISIAIKIPHISRILQFLNVKTTCTVKAISKIFIIGSDKLSRNRRTKLLLFSFFRLLSPCFVLDSITSFSVSPLIFLSICSSLILI